MNGELLWLSLALDVVKANQQCLLNMLVLDECPLNICS
jgi:hypothetical protein